MKSNELTTIVAAATERLASGESTSALRAEYLGKEGIVPTLLRGLSTMPAEERPIHAATLARIRTELQQLLETKPVTAVEEAIFADLTIPAFNKPTGSIHPISAMIEEMVEIFRGLAFEVVEGPEIVGDQENFEHLNMGPEHPARDGHDSFYLSDSILLRTQTTAVQVLEMQRRQKMGQLPIRVVVPGKTYRRESDQTHSAMFHQIDAVVVDSQTTFADLKGTLDYFAKQLFGDQVETRFRPHHFPFTEPSAEMDIRWKGTSALEGKHTQWLEMGGCGMIHPHVLSRAGINPRTHQGWAFGMSIERPIMVRNHIPDLRLLYANSTTTLEQFSRYS